MVCVEESLFSPPNMYVLGLTLGHRALREPPFTQAPCQAGLFSVALPNGCAACDFGFLLLSLKLATAEEMALYKTTWRSTQTLSGLSCSAL